MFEKWELVSLLFEKDKNRWLLKMKIADSELDEFVDRFIVTGRQAFYSTADDYNWGLVILIMSTRTTGKNVLKTIGRNSTRRAMR